MLRAASSAFVVLVMAPALHAQTAPDAAELTRLLKDFLSGASRNDAAVHDRFWAEDLIYTGSAGRRMGKADILRDVRSEKAGAPPTTYTAEDIRIHQYGDTAVVAFRLIGTAEKDGRATIASFLNTGTFLKRNGKWQAVSWQATVVPRPENEARDAVAAAEGTGASARAEEPPRQPSVDLPPPLARVLADYERAWQGKDAAALAALFTEDGFVLSSGNPPVRGRARIEKHYAGHGGPLALRALAFATEGPLGYIIGAFARQKGEPDRGKFTLTLRKGADGRWLIMSDMDNDNKRP